MDDKYTHLNYSRIEKSIKYLIANFRNQPSLEEMAAHVGLSPFHFQRIFSEWAGVTPKKFLQYLTLEQLKKEISNTDNLLVAADRVGLSAQSRVYDLFVKVEAMTPGEYKKRGEGVSLEYGIASTPFGACLIVNSPKGICNLQFVDDNKTELLQEIKEEWCNAVFCENNQVANLLAKQIFSPASGIVSPLSVYLKGTPFQLKVWKALLSVPYGKVVTYAGLAKCAGEEKAVRAVASVVARNPIGYLIPCHRVIRNEGIVGQYHWKSERKAAMIGWEKATLEEPK